MVENQYSNLVSPFYQSDQRSLPISPISIQTHAQLECQLCHTFHHSQLSLRDHMISDHEVDKQLTELLDIELGITLEDLSAPNSPNSGTSEATADQSELLECPKCGKGCKGIKGLNQHMAKSHRNRRKNAVCGDCGRGFKDRHQLNFHVKQVHLEVTKVPCEYCGKMIYNKYALSDHIRNVHHIFYI